MNEPRVFVGSRTLAVAPHALRRYQERVKPAFDLAMALADLGRVIRHAELRDRAPAWVKDDGRADEWIALGGAIVFPVVKGHISSCLTLAEPGDEWQQARSEVRREKAEKRGKRGAERRFKSAAQSKRGNLAREARRRRRELREGVDG